MKGHWFVLVPPGQRQGDDPDLPPLGMHPSDSYCWMAERWENTGLDADYLHFHWVADYGAISWLNDEAKDRVAVVVAGEVRPLTTVETPEWLACFRLEDLYRQGDIGGSGCGVAP